MKRLRLPRIKITFWRLVFAAIFVTGLYATVIRFGKGLGAASGLSDAFPWGIWIGFDVMCGVALAAGGFTVAAIVYVLHIKRFEPILRPAVLTAFLGYLLVAVSLLYDLGRPYRIWHPMVWGNHHSVMFEVAWCVMLYLTVLALEFSPVVFERFRFGRALKVVHKITPLLVILGVILSTLHQSSLGTLFVIAPNKLHGLWYTPMLPVLFWVSAIAVGLSMTIFESTLSHRAFGVSLHPDLVGSLGKVISAVLAVYLTLKLGSLGLRDSLHLALEDSLESRLFLLEMALVVTPMILFLWKRVRKSPQGMFYTAVLVILGVVLNRLNVGITGIERYAGNVYFPTFLEGASTIFVLACGFFAFAVITKYFNIFPAHHASPDEAAAENAPEAEPGAAAPLKLRSPIATKRGALVLVGLVTLFGGVALWTRLFSTDADPVPLAPPQAIISGFRKINVRKIPDLILPEDYTFPKAENSPGTVVFSHERHVQLNSNACTNCHPRPYRMAKSDIATIECEYGRMNGCGHCHNGTGSFDIKQGCRLCHRRGPTQTALGPSSHPLPWRLADHLMPTKDRDFGPVFFSHRAHTKGAKLECEDCHPSPYPMKRTVEGDPALTDRDSYIDWGHRCGICHDGIRAFAQEEKCAGCHTRWSRVKSEADCAECGAGKAQRGEALDVR